MTSTGPKPLVPLINGCPGSSRSLRGSPSVGADRSGRCNCRSSLGSGLQGSGLAGVLDRVHGSHDRLFLVDERVSLYVQALPALGVVRQLTGPAPVRSLDRPFVLGMGEAMTVGVLGLVILPLSYLIAALLLYVIIRFGVKHGMRAYYAEAVSSDSRRPEKDPV